MISVRGAAIALAVWAALVSGGSIAAPAPSLEEDYAKLCAGRPEPPSETCLALKQALIDKLSGKGLDPATPQASATPQSPAAESVESQRAEWRRRWGLYAEMVGKSYFVTSTDGTPFGIWEYKWNVPGVSMLTIGYPTTATGEIKSQAECGPQKIFRRFDPATSKITRRIDKPCWPSLPDADVIFQPDGSSIETEIPRTSGPKAFRGKYRDLISRRADGTFRSARQERKKDGSWQNLGFGTQISHERTPEYLAFLRAEQQRLAQARANSSDGNSGLVGAMAMGLGAAMAGGNAEQVMGMAMKGAELTTDNEMSRNVLAGQGDAMIAQSTQRMNGDESGSTVVPTSTDSASNPIPRALGLSADSETTYYDCIGTVKRHTSAGDVTDTIYYGIVTSPRMDVNGARELFRQRTGSDAASDTEHAGASCHPYKTRAEAQAANNDKIARDGKGNWRQVTGIDLSL